MIVENGSHEYRVWEVLPAQGGVAMGIPDLKVCLGSCRQARLGLSGESWHQDAGMNQRDERLMTETRRRRCLEDWSRKGIKE
jgi:hypothetical protein